MEESRVQNVLNERNNQSAKLMRGRRHLFRTFSMPSFKKCVRFCRLNRINYIDNKRQLPPLRWQRSKIGYDILTLEKRNEWTRDEADRSRA